MQTNIMASKIFYFIVFAVLQFTLEVKANVPSSNLWQSDDEEYLISVANDALKTVVKGNSTLGAKSLDPVRVDEISGSMYGMNFILSPANFDGIDSCKVTDLKLDLENSQMHLVCFCNKIVVYGKYKMDGVLLGFFPANGEGEARAPAKDYEVGMDTNLIFVNGSDGNTYLNIGHDFTLDMNLKGGVVFHLTGLFNGNKVMSQAAHDFANKNWKILTEEFQEPLFKPLLNKVIDETNKYLNTIPVSELFLQE